MLQLGDIGHRLYVRFFGYLLSRVRNNGGMNSAESVPSREFRGTRRERNEKKFHSAEAGGSGTENLVPFLTLFTEGLPIQYLFTNSDIICIITLKIS